MGERKQRIEEPTNNEQSKENVQIAEVSINLELLNNKLNYIISVLEKKNLNLE